MIFQKMEKLLLKENHTNLILSSAPKKTKVFTIQMVEVILVFTASTSSIEFFTSYGHM